MGLQVELIVFALQCAARRASSLTILSAILSALCWVARTGPQVPYHLHHISGRLLGNVGACQVLRVTRSSFTRAQHSVLTRPNCLVLLQQPDVSELQQVLQPVAQHMMEASTAAENRRSAAFNQLKVVAEALHGLSWLAYTGPNCGEHSSETDGWHFTPLQLSSP